MCYLGDSQQPGTKRRKLSTILAICALLTGMGLLNACSDKSQAIGSIEFESLEEELRKEPNDLANERPVKRDESGRVVEVETPFTPEDIKTGDYIAAKDYYRQLILKNSVSHGELSTEETFAAHEDPKLLVDNSSSVVYNLQQMEKDNLLKAELPQQPWSDFYWPTYKGLLGNRYGDSRFPMSSNWKTNYDYILDNPAGPIIAEGSARAIDNLSPSEKYDLMVGDTEGNLTKAMWAEGKAYYDANKKVESWFGICHGWAAASYTMPRPTAAVKVNVPGLDEPLTFYPSDIKALASLLWARASGPVRHLGGRCNDKKPAENDDGRIRSSNCFDSNPGAWHIAIVNQIGISKRSVILDAAYDYEVWNQPIRAYSYRYFNPKTRDETDTLAEAIVSREDFENDRFRRYRNQRAKSVVGIAMSITYMSETSPSQATSDSPGRDVERTVRYLYDVELDADGNIIGGEWYQKMHPDFLWTPVQGARAVSITENYLNGSFLAGTGIPTEWLPYLKVNSRNGQPAARIVEELIQKSVRRGNGEDESPSED